MQDTVFVAKNVKAAPVKKPPRLMSLDLARGLIMTVMAWDHCRDIVSTEWLNSNESWGGIMPSFDNDAAMFLQRFITHFCAPGFFWSMGVGMALFSCSRLERAGWNGSQVFYHYLVRGLILLAIDRVVNPAFFLGPLVGYEARGGTASDHFWLTVFLGDFQVCTALGLTMILCGSLLPLIHTWSKIPLNSLTEHRGDWWNAGRGQLLALLIASAGFIIANFFIVGSQGPYGAVGAVSPFPNQAAHATGFAEVVQRVLLFPGPTDWGALILYPLLPWSSITFLGIAMGFEFKTDPEVAQTNTAPLAFLGLICFNIVRAVGGAWGNYRGWPRGDGVHFHPTQVVYVSPWIEWFNICKYPPDLAYALLTVSVNLLILRGFFWVQQLKGSKWVELWLEPLLTFGRAPLFFYVVHFWVFCMISVTMNAFGLKGLTGGHSILVWLAVVVGMLFVTRPFAKFKAQQPIGSLWHLF